MVILASNRVLKRPIKTSQQKRDTEGMADAEYTELGASEQRSRSKMVLLVVLVGTVAVVVALGLGLGLGLRGTGGTAQAAAGRAATASVRATARFFAFLLF